MMGSTSTIAKIDHIGVPVWDADAATTFFEHLDVTIAFTDQLADYNVLAVFLEVDGVYVELLEPTGPGNVKTFLERNGPGYQHTAYRVEDIETAVAELRDVGVMFQTNDPVPGAGDSRIIFLEERHTGGLQTELVER